MNRNEAIAYLTRCVDDNGTAGSRYGYRSADVAPIAYRHALIAARWSGEPLTTDALDHSMSLAVNDSPDIAADIAEYVTALAGADIDAMVEGYIDCQLWAQLDWNHGDENDNPTLDENYERSDVSDDYVDSVRQLFSEIVTAHPLSVRMYLNRRDYRSGYADGQDRSILFGHDFYLTREHHGAGFWDRGLGDLGRYLTDIAHAYGAADDLHDNGNGELTA